MIESIKGISTRDMPLAYAVLLLQGEPGIDRRIQRGARAPARPAADRHAHARRLGSASRGHAACWPARWAISTSTRFRRRTIKEVAAAIQKLQKDGAQKLIVDVRNCAMGTPRGRHRGGQSLPEQGPHHVPSGPEGAAAEFRGRSGQGRHQLCRWRSSPTMARPMRPKSWRRP